MSTPVALVFGAGPRVGQSVASAFAAQGYKVAVVSRSLKAEPSSPDQLQIKADLTDPTAVAKTFAEVEDKLGAPHVVVYNAAAVNFVDGKDPLTQSVESFVDTFHVNTSSLFAAAQQSLVAFAKVPESASRTFIYTGNICNLSPIPGVLDLGAGKAASASILQVAAEAYKHKGFKFYYADERTADGAPVYNGLDGPAHGRHYVKLSEGKSQEAWLQTFVNGIGYKKF